MAESSASLCQPGILAPVPKVARYLQFQIHPGRDVRAAMTKLEAQPLGDAAVIGLGHTLVASYGVTIDGLRDHPTHVGAGFRVPSTPAAVWIWLRGDDRGDLVHDTRRWIQTLRDGFELESTVDAFQFRDSRDLTGYEDGTENPTGDKAVTTALVANSTAGIEGSSFVAVQQWVHDLDAFESMSQPERDHTFGRRLSDNEEIEDAPASAHVKRTAQESFDPEAFVLRRSMPWADDYRAGLVFVAFGRSFDAFEALLKRMTGGDDGITDALFRITQPVAGAYFWCPPAKDDRLDLSALARL